MARKEAVVVQLMFATRPSEQHDRGRYYIFKKVKRITNKYYDDGDVFDGNN